MFTTLAAPVRFSVCILHVSLFFNDLHRYILLKISRSCEKKCCAVVNEVRMIRLRKYIISEGNSFSDFVYF